MTQISVADAKKILLDALPSRVVHWVTGHRNHWYICATDPTDGEEGDMNPFFKVHTTTGELSEFYAIQDLALFQQIVAQVKAINTPKSR